MDYDSYYDAHDECVDDPCNRPLCPACDPRIFPEGHPTPPLAPRPDPAPARSASSADGHDAASSPPWLAAARERAALELGVPLSVLRAARTEQGKQARFWGECAREWVRLAIQATDPGGVEWCVRTAYRDARLATRYAHLAIAVAEDQERQTR